MKLRKVLALGVVTAMMLGLTACGGKGTTATKENTTSETTSEEATSTGEKEKVVVWAWDEAFNIAALNKAKASYEGQNANVEIEIVNMAQNDIVQKLHTSLSAGTYEGLPNVVLIEDYKIQNYLQSYPGEIKELSGIISADDFAEYKLGVMTEGDKLYGVPFDSGVAALFYRTDYVEQAGYTKEDMSNLTWDKYIEIGKAVKEKVGVDMLTLDPNDMALIRIMMQSAGTWYVNDEGEVNIKDNQALKEAVQIYADLTNGGFVKQVSDWDQFVSAFQSGEVASVPTGCWIAASVKAAADQSGKWAVTAIPRIGTNSNSVNASNLGGSSWYVLDNVGNSDVAADFLAKTFATDTSLLNELAADIALVSTVKAASQEANYSVPSEFFGNQMIFTDFATWTEQIPSVNYGLHTYAIDDILTGAVQNVIAGADAGQELESTQAQVEAAIGN